MIELLPWAGWIVAALLVGLWWGERGRRKDTQRILNVAPASAPQIEPGPPAIEDQALERDTDAFREKFIADAVKEGYSRSAAERDFERVQRQLVGGGNA